MVLSFSKRVFFLFLLCFSVFYSLSFTVDAATERDEKRLEQWLKGHDLDFDKIKKTQKLDLSGKDIYELPGLIRAFENMTILRAVNSKIDQLPREIGQLKNLRQIDLEHNDLESLPEEIGNLENVTTLKLRHNKNLKVLPNSIINLKKITTLTIDEGIQNKEILINLPLLSKLFVGSMVLSNKNDIQSYLNRQ